jgi:amidophosphoribosyltransferase
MLSSAPMFIAPCYFGTDIPSKQELMACNHTLEEMRELIGADSLGFLSVDSLHKIAPECGCGFCDGCFTEHYPVPVEE